ncbi:MAG: helical backbone metal receptor [bacterium]
MGDRVDHQPGYLLARLIATLLALSSLHPSHAGISIVDDTDTPVYLERPAERIVAISPHASELAQAAGASNKLVAIDAHAETTDTIDHLPRISSAFGLDRESILALQPDLVIGWASGNRPADLAWLSRAGVPVYLSEPSALSGIADNIEAIGKLANTSHIAANAAIQFRADLAEVCAHRQQTPPRRVYYEIWPSPRMTVGGRHWLNEALSRVGLQNVFEDQPRAVFTISNEAALLRPADYLIVDPELDHPERQPADTLIVAGNPWLGRPGPAVIKGIRKLCAELDRADELAATNNSTL